MQNYAKRCKITPKRKITPKGVKLCQKCKITPKGVKLHQKRKVTPKGLFKNFLECSILTKLPKNNKRKYKDVEARAS